MKKIRKPDGGKYIPAPQCEHHFAPNRPCASQMVYSNGKPFLYRVTARIRRDGHLLVYKELVFCENHRAEQERQVLGSESLELEWELICETAATAQRV